MERFGAGAGTRRRAAGVMAGAALLLGWGWAAAPAMAQDPDTTPPVVTMTQPASGSSTADTTPTFAGVAGHEVGDLGSVEVRIFQGTSTEADVFASFDVTPDDATDAWQGSPADPLPLGTYTAVAGQEDEAGNVGMSAAVTFSIVDQTAPVVTLTAPADGSSSQDTTPTFEGVAGRAPGDETAVTVRIWKDAASGAALLSLPATADAATGAFSVTSSALAPGTYVARAEQADGSGNVGQSATRTFTITAPPASGGGGSGGGSGSGGGTGGGGSSANGAPGTAQTGAPGASSSTGVIVVGAPSTSPPPANGLTTRRTMRTALGDLLRGWTGKSRPGMAALLSGGLQVQFDAPAAGTLQVRWVAKVRTGRHHRVHRIVIARGTAVATAAGAATLTVRVTKAGRRLLDAQPRRMRIVAVATFAPEGGMKPVVRRHRISLRG